MEAAMELARQELGEEALLINARPASPETRYLGDYEVVFGVDIKPVAGSTVAPTVAPSSADGLAQEIAGLKREVQAIFQMLRSSFPQPELGAMDDSGAGGSGIYSHLTEQGIAPDLVKSVQSGTHLGDLFTSDPARGVPGGLGRVVLLVGPPGAGKTTTLVKLAARYGLQTRKPAQILSVDVRRIAAADQLRTLASILGIGCEIAESTSTLAQMLAEHRSKDLVLIDTPGLTQSEMNEAEDLAEFVRSEPAMDVHLVLPAYASDLTQFVECYSHFAPRKLLFTHLDQTRRFGPLVNESARWSLPISFLCNGQQIPDDIRPATVEGIIDLLTREPLVREAGSGPAVERATPLAMSKGAGA